MWRNAQEGARDRHWPRVERLLAGLPPGLARQTKLLEYDLALSSSGTGQFRDVFLGVDRFPVLSIGTWLLDDLAVRERLSATAEDDDDAEGRIFVAALLMAVGVHLVERLGDDATFISADHLALIQALAARSALEVAAAVPSAVPAGPWFDGVHAALSLDGFAADHARLSSDPGRAIEPNELLRGRWMRPALITAAAAIALSGRPGGEALFGAVSAVLEDMGSAFQILDDLGSFHHDLATGRPTWPIHTVAAAVGVPLQPWPDVPMMLGALVLTGSLPAITAAALDRVRAARRGATDLGLSTFEAFLADVETRIVERGNTDGPRSTAGPLVTRHEPPLSRALAMAEGALLADPTFRESWETHRDGMLGAPLVVSRFPAGLILEILAGRGHDVGPLIDRFIRDAADDDFRYFDHPDSGSDTDTIGVALRLLPEASDRALAGEILAPALRWVEGAILEAGRVPVWLPDRKQRSVLDLGDHCGTVAAHLLLGLIAAGHRSEALVVGAEHLFGHIGDAGLGANVNYPPIYALDVFLRLSARMGPAHGESPPSLAAARSRLTDDLDQAIRRQRLSPQDAALLIRACRSAGREEAIRPAWVTTILQGQRFDGSWLGEPFAAAPNRGRSVTWYSSTTLTTALCYDALAGGRPVPASLGPGAAVGAGLGATR